MASNDHPQPDGPGPVSNKDDRESNTAAATTPHSLDPIPQLPPLALVSSSDSMKDPRPASPADKPPQNDTVTDATDTKPVAGGETTQPATETQQPDTTEPPPALNVSTESSEPKAAELAPEPSSPASDSPSKEAEDSGPSLVITLLLTTGSRHPFKIDGNYLKKRSVNVENYDPFAMSVYTLKELIWREWRQDWETRPSSPSSIRLISFGKLLDDKAPLSDSKFNRDAPNVVHMTVKPQELLDEEDSKGQKAQYPREREASERSPGCRCIIQ